MSIHTDGLPPYTMRCSECGQTWTPQPAPGRQMTDNRLNQQATAHWDTCPNRPEGPR